MGAIKECKAALRIFGDDLIPEELSRLFGHPPEKAWIKGYQYQTSSGKLVVKKTGAWILGAKPSEHGDLDGQISYLLDCTNVTIDVWASLAQKFEIDVFCGWFMGDANEGVSVSPKTLLKLGERNIGLEIDVYAPSADE